MCHPTGTAGTKPQLGNVSGERRVLGVGAEGARGEEGGCLGWERRVLWWEWRTLRVIMEDAQMGVEGAQGDHGDAWSGSGGCLGRERWMQGQQSEGC